ncbi:sulfite exporter TauE/SafE family protein [Hyalangium rubrum]|uniref:Probable membrane transporter protein n=1 Tax=Hyalangium rubrum TaxID=3103134 RepID=A0ABU5HAC8_9BACT|nr:sulfite exporter TauE/SafE family protein [Hyalangium sp. s54d21]MDY7229075.1 sulfite exporter TauE/SafE family protein [Hyalangium sp. s54d21]
MTTLLLGAALMLVAGLSLGLLGGGGSILTVPILVYVLGMEPRSAIATSLVVVGVTSATGMLSHARAGRLEWRVGLLFGAAGMVGAAVGGRVGKFVPPALLLVAFAGMVLATAIALLRYHPAPVSLPMGSARQRLFVVLRNGFGVGLLTGLVGAGGGFMVVPALVLFGGLSMPRAVATSLLVITLNSASGLFSATQSGAPVDWVLAGGMSGTAIAGSLVGARLGRGLSPEGLRTGFALFIAALGVFILTRELATLVHVTSGRAALAGGLSAGALILVSAPLLRRRWVREQPSP